MFDYDKIIKKLGKFEELPDKKKKKLMERIFIDEEFREWFYGIGENQNAQPMTPQMVERLLEDCSRPKQLRYLCEFIEETDFDKFDHTARTLAFTVAEHAVVVLNKVNAETKEKYENRELSPKEVAKRNGETEKYSGDIQKLVEKIREKANHEVKEMSKKSNLPKGLVFTCYFLVPSRKYIPKRKVTFYMNQMLKEIYTFTGNEGMENISMIRWGNLFGPLFGNEMTSSAAVAVLLEGVKRIEQYKDLDNFDDVKSIWNSLTNFALSELDNAPDGIRRQMIELYIKKVDRIYHNGNGPRLRVNMLSLPREFSNLADTVSRYSERISAIMKNNLRPMTEFKEKYVDKPKKDDSFEGQKPLSPEEKYESNRAVEQFIERAVKKQHDERREREFDRLSSGKSESEFGKVFDSKKDDEDDERSTRNDRESRWAIDLDRRKNHDDEDDDRDLISGIKNEKLFETDTDRFLKDDDEDEQIPLPPSAEDDDE